MDLRETRDAHHEAIHALAAPAYETQNYANDDEKVDQKNQPNAEKRLRDED